MVAISKLFEPPLKYFHCSQLPIHCDKTCFHAYFHDNFQFIRSGLRYYSPLVLSPLLLKGQTISMESLLDTLKFYLETVLASSMTGSFVCLWICLFRNARGKFEMWTTFIWPGILGAQCSWWFSKRTHRIFFTSTTQVALEALLRQNKNGFTNFLLNSTSIQTCIFMITSTIIMHFKRLREYNGFWFIKPEIMPEKNSKSNEMPHKTEGRETIWKYLLKDFKTYLIYGLGLDFLNTILKNLDYCKSKGLLRFLRQTFKCLRFNMTYFFVSYIGIYKLSFYYLNKYLDTVYSSNVAAFLGGSSYAFLNKLTCNTFAIVLAAQILWQHFCQKTSNNKDNENGALESVKKIPFARILFPINIGYLIYMFLNHHDCINSLGKNLLNAVTDYKIQRMFDYIRKNDFELIVKESSLRKHMGAF